MHSSPNYDYVIHGDHIHWCNVEAHSMEVCQEWAMIDHMSEPGQNLATEAYYSRRIFHAGHGRSPKRERQRPVGLSVTGYEVEERLPPPVAELIR